MSSSPSSSRLADDASMTDVPSTADLIQQPSRRARREAEAATAALAVPARRTGASVVAAVAAAPANAVAAGRRVVANAARIAVVGGVMAVAAGLLIGTTTPASALLATASSETIEAAAIVAPAEERVGVVAEGITATVPAQASRDSYTTGLSEALQMASYQSAGLGYAPGYIPTSGSIRWPFPYSTTMSSGFGELRGDSIHTGLDFNPGIGAPVQSIAAGVVISAGWGPTSALGYYVVIQHDINGQLVESTYAHMLDGSSDLSPGQVVPVGTIVGNVGTTGLSTGPHLHLIIKINGTPVDPYEWLTVNATNK